MAGRPRGHERLDTPVSVPMTSAAVEKIDALARREKTTRAEYVRGVLMRAIEPEERQEEVTT